MRECRTFPFQFHTFAGLNNCTLSKANSVLCQFSIASHMMAFLMLGPVRTSCCCRNCVHVPSCLHLRNDVVQSSSRQNRTNHIHQPTNANENRKSVDYGSEVKVARVSVVESVRG